MTVAEWRRHLSYLAACRVLDAALPMQANRHMMMQSFGGGLSGIRVTRNAGKANAGRLRAQG
jgi:hypothetical protein